MTTDDRIAAARSWLAHGGTLGGAAAEVRAQVGMLRRSPGTPIPHERLFPVKLVVEQCGLAFRRADHDDGVWRWYLHHEAADVLFPPVQGFWVDYPHGAPL